MNQRPYDRLLRRAQFLLAPTGIDGYQGWNSCPVGENLQLWTHPDLEVTRALRNSKRFLLLGDLVCPKRAAMSNESLLQALVEECDSLDDLVRETNACCGRWLMIAQFGASAMLFGDAAGLRQVVYTSVDTTGTLLCASDPKTIAERLDLQASPEASDFIDWFSSINNEYWWPGTCTLYSEIVQLLPNHSLDLVSGKTSRFWPNRDIEKLHTSDAIHTLSTDLVAHMTSAANRSDLAFGLSAGMDSRLVLAASKPIKDKLEVYTVKRHYMSQKTPDVGIPCKLAAKLGLQHRIIEPKRDADAEFSRVFRESTSTPHPFRMGGMQTNFESFGLNKIAVLGNVSEVARCYYRPQSPAEPVTGRLLSRLTDMQEHPFSVRHFDRWLDGLGNMFNVNVLDLFYWEQRTGRWFAGNCLEFDIAWKGVYTPFNSRDLLAHFLATDEALRARRNTPLYLDIIRELWREVLSEPVNPREKQPIVIRIIKRLYRHAQALRPRS